MNIFKNKIKTKTTLISILILISILTIFSLKDKFIFELNHHFYINKLEYFFDKYHLVSVLILIFLWIFWIILVGFGTPIIIFNSFFFSTFEALIISLIAVIAGSFACYFIFRNFFFSKLKKKFKNILPKHKKFFKNNSLFLFYLFRSVPGIPLHLKNTLPVLFFVKYTNFLTATILVEAPTILMNILIIKGLIDLNSEENSFPLLTILKILIPLIILFLISKILKKLRVKNKLN